MTDRAHRLALLLQALEELDREKADFNADWSARKKTLDKQAWILRNEILGGQLTLVPDETPPEKPESAA